MSTSKRPAPYKRDHTTVLLLLSPQRLLYDTAMLLDARDAILSASLGPPGWGVAGRVRAVAAVLLGWAEPIVREYFGWVSCVPAHVPYQRTFGPGVLTCCAVP